MKVGGAAGQRDAVLTQDPAGVTPVAVVVPFQGPVAVVVEQPRPADVMDRGEFVRRRVGPFEIVRPVSVASGYLVVQTA